MNYKANIVIEYADFTTGETVTATIDDFVDNANQVTKE